MGGRGAKSETAKGPCRVTTAGRGPSYPRIVNRSIDMGAFEVQRDGVGPVALQEGFGVGPSLSLLVASRGAQTPRPPSLL